MMAVDPERQTALVRPDEVEVFHGRLAPQVAQVYVRVPTLPGGEMVVACVDRDTTDANVCSANSTMVVTITWELQSDAADPLTETVITSIVPGSHNDE